MAQTCQKVVIINKGKVVAIDTPDALTERLHGAQTLFVEAQGPADAIQSALRSLPGVVNVSVSDRARRVDGSRLSRSTAKRASTFAATSPPRSCEAAGACSSCGRCA